MTLTTKIIVYPDTNCWRGDLQFLDSLNQYKMRGACDIGCTYTIAFECATAENIGLSKAALQRILGLTNVWLRGRDEMLCGVISHIRNGWLDEVSVRFLDYDQYNESDHWKEKLKTIKVNHEEDRNLKLKLQEKYVEDAEVTRREFLQEVEKEGKLGAITDDDLKDWLLSCFDPENLQWRGIILEDVLMKKGLYEGEILSILKNFNQFPGLKLSYGNMMHSYLRQIQGRRIDKSYIQDTVHCLLASSSCIFVTRDKFIHQTASFLGLQEIVSTPEAMLSRLDETSSCSRS